MKGVRHQNAFQDFYPDKFSHCFGCGKSNNQGYQIKSYWEGEPSENKTIAYFTPEPFHSGGVPGYAYGGLIASLFDCHGAASAAAAKYHVMNREMGSASYIRFVTASLKVDFLKPTPLTCEWIIIGKISELEKRKATVELSLEANGEMHACGVMIALMLSSV